MHVTNGYKVLCAQLYTPIGENVVICHALPWMPRSATSVPLSHQTSAFPTIGCLFICFHTSAAKSLIAFLNSLWHCISEVIFLQSRAYQMLKREPQPSQLRQMGDNAYHTEGHGHSDFFYRVVNRIFFAKVIANNEEYFILHTLNYLLLMLIMK